MIPDFPKFKRVELSDQKEIEAITGSLAPYSDYNFMSLWSWNTTGGIAASLLHGNLVVRFMDYLTGLPFYSFLGTKEVTAIAHELLRLSVNEGLPTTLKLLPEASVTGIDAGIFTIAEDRDGFDYIYGIDTFLEMKGGAFEAKRKQLRHFENTFSSEVVQLDLSHPLVKDQVMELCHEWARFKMEKGSNEYFHNEFLALLRYLNVACTADAIALGVYHDRRLIAISFGENNKGGYHTCHFQKALTSQYKGLNVFLVREVAKALATKGMWFINWEQDLGIPGLRESKQSYQPCTFSENILYPPAEIEISHARYYTVIYETTNGRCEQVAHNQDNERLDNYLVYSIIHLVAVRAAL